MSLHIASINSGSNGNCYYIGNSNEAILVDVGLTCKEVETRMKEMQLDIKKVAAIFISHEHTDHIKGVAVLAKKYKLPVYITLKTRRRWINGINHLMHNFEAKQSIMIGDLEIIPFLKFHDAIHPHSFIVKHQQTVVGVFTDIGKVCNELIYYFKQCHAAFLESNYDEEMLEKGSYPQILKNRIKGGEGHLSNNEALKLFINHRHIDMSHLLLSHLSKENNLPQLVFNLFNQHANNINISIASRHKPSDVFHITAKKSGIKKLHIKSTFQMLLFE